MKAFFNWLDSCGKLGKTLIVLALILAAASTIKLLMFMVFLFLC